MVDNTQKIFTNKAISLAAFFGGPLAAGFLIGKNFKAFGNDEAAHNSPIIGIIATLLLFGSLISIPESIIDKIPNALIPAICTSIIVFIVNKYQGIQIKEFLENDGLQASRWTAFGYGVLGLLINLAFIFIMVFSIPIKGYENKVSISKHVVLHYSNEVDETYPTQIAKTIKDIGFVSPNQKADLFLNVENNTYKLRFVVANESLLTSDSKVILGFNELESLLNNSLKLDKKIEIGFIDENMNKTYELPPNTKTVGKESEVLLNLKLYQVDGFHKIYYNDNMPISDIKIVGESIKKLRSYFPTYQEIDIVFLNNGSDYTIKFFVVKNLWNDPTLIDQLKGSVEYFRDGGIEKIIHLVMVDNETLEEKQL